LDAKVFGLVAGLLVLTGAMLLWIRRRRLADPTSATRESRSRVNRIPTAHRDAFPRERVSHLKADELPDTGVVIRRPHWEAQWWRPREAERTVGDLRSV
jgi:hypothetical protein